MSKYAVEFKRKLTENCRGFITESSYGEEY
jgi:hypothetical protein